MKNNLIYPLIATVLLTGAACRGDRESANQQQFESVQEGAAAGVTSTIHGPGETIPPLTGTNMDTTTAFTLNPNAVPPGTAQPGGTIAGTLPPPMQAGSSPAPTALPTGTYVPQQPATRSTTTRTTTVTQQPRPVSPQPEPQPVEPQPQPVQPTETVEPPTQTAPPPTDTTATQPPPPAQTAPPPAEKPKEKKEKPPADEDDGEQTDTAEPPPPPPGRWVVGGGQ